MRDRFVRRPASGGSAGAGGPRVTELTPIKYDGSALSEKLHDVDIFVKEGEIISSCIILVVEDDPTIRNGHACAGVREQAV